MRVVYTAYAFHTFNITGFVSFQLSEHTLKFPFCQRLFQIGGNIYICPFNMLNSKKTLESFLQKLRFKKALPYLGAEVLDFGGNNGELKQFVKGNYTLTNYDYSAMNGKQFDSIVALAVIEHIPVAGVFHVFEAFKKSLQPGGVVFITTPTPMAKPVLKTLAWIGLLDRQNIAEHKHYWTKKEIYELAAQSGLKIDSYSKFQLGFNQFASIKHP